MASWESLLDRANRLQDRALREIEDMHRASDDLRKETDRLCVESLERHEICKGQTGKINAMREARNVPSESKDLLEKKKSGEDGNR